MTLILEAVGRQLKGLVLCGATVCIASSPALAQNATKPIAAGTPAPELNEIIVTAQKRSENSQKVPIAIAAFSAKALEAANVTGLADLVNVTPSLRFQYAGPSGTTFLRGVGNSQSFAGAEAEVQTYIDGVYQPSGAAAYLKFNNIERVEVDKGPQGTLFGRNATGGVIQIFTRDPTFKPRLDASVGYGKYNLKEGDLYASTGFSNKVAGDVAIHYDDRDGWGRNTFLNRGVYAAQSFGVRSKFIIDFAKDTRLTIIGDYSRDRSDLGTAFALAYGPYRLSLAAPIPPIPDKFTLTEDSASNAKVKRYGASAKFDTKLGDLSFVSISSYRYSQSRSVLDADSTPLPIVLGQENRTEKQVSQEFQLLSPSRGRFRWIVGAYLYYNQAAEDPAQLSGFLTRNPAFGGAQAIQSFSQMTTKSVAGYGQGTFDLTASTHITAGLRYTHDHRDQEASTAFVYATGPGAPPPFLGLNKNDYPSVNFNALTGKFTISQDIADHAMAYMGYSRGYKAGTFNNQLVLANPGPALEPEHVDAFEGGLKSELFDRRLRLNVAAFYYKYSNLQVNVFQSFRIGLQNSGSSNIKGLEADTQLAVTPKTTLVGGASILTAKYKSFSNAPLYAVNPPNSPNPAPPIGVGGFGGIIIGAADASGNTLPEAPRFSGYLGLSQRVDFTAGTLDLNSTLSYQSKIYFTPDNRFGQDGYAILSASAKFTTANKRFDFTLWGRNLTNKHAFGALTVAGYRVAGYPIEPISVGGRIGVHF